MAYYNAYAQRLRPYGFGYPLWIPEPDENLPSQYREVGVSIGDVGILTSEGRFDFLFNICQSATHPINDDSVPQGFIQFKLGNRDVAKESSRYPPGTMIANSGPPDGKKWYGGTGHGIAINFSCESAEGALLVLPDGASGEDLVNLDTLRPFIRQNVGMWIEFAQAQRGHMGPLFIVTGCDKAKSWVVASFSGPAKTTLAGQVDNMTYSSQSELSVSPQTRFSLTPSDTPNQCVFVRGLTISSDNHYLACGGSQADNIPYTLQPEYSVPQQITTGIDAHPPDGTYSIIDTPSHCDFVTKKLRYVQTDQTYIDRVISMYKDALMPIWSPLSHENIVPLLGIHTHGDSLPKFEIPYYKQGNIIDHNRRHPDANKLNQITQIAAGLSYLHGKNISHGNICPGNVLIADNGSACISDIALNVLMRQLNYDTHTPTPATWSYKPREELLNATPMGPKADVYSWASVVYEVFCNKRPYHGYPYGRGIVQIINHGHLALDKPVEISPKLWGIIQQCWMLNPDDRPAMHQVELDLRGL